MGDARIEMESAGGRLVLEHAAPGVVFSRIIGHVDLPLVRAVTTAMDELDFPHPIQSFKDWSKASGYSTDARVFGTKWLLDHVDPAPVLHVLTSNRLLAMGVATASLTLTLAKRELVSYSSPSAFDAALREATARTSAG